MSLRYLAYALPSVQLFYLIRATRKEMSLLIGPTSESKDTQAVQEIASRILNAENHPESSYEQRIQQLPPNFAKRSVQVLSLPLEASLGCVYSLQGPAQLRAAFPNFLSIPPLRESWTLLLKPNLTEQEKEALPWLVSRETYLLLENDASVYWVRSFALSLIVTTLAVGFFRTLSGVLGTTIPTILGSGLLHSHQTSDQADEFATKHCTLKENQAAIAWLEEKQDVSGFVENPQNGLLLYDREIPLIFPNKEERIQKIQDWIQKRFSAPSSQEV